MREMKARISNVGVEMRIDKSGWKLNSIMFTDDTFPGRVKYICKNWEMNSVLFVKGQS